MQHTRLVRGGSWSATVGMCDRLQFNNRQRRCNTRVNAVASLAWSFCDCHHRLVFFVTTISTYDDVHMGSEWSGCCTMAHCLSAAGYCYESCMEGVDGVDGVDVLASGKAGRRGPVPACTACIGSRSLVAFGSIVSCSPIEELFFLDTKSRR